MAMIIGTIISRPGGLASVPEQDSGGWPLAIVGNWMSGEMCPRIREWRMKTSSPPPAQRGLARFSSSNSDDSFLFKPQYGGGRWIRRTERLKQEGRSLFREVNPGANSWERRGRPCYSALRLHCGRCGMPLLSRLGGAPMFRARLQVKHPWSPQT